MATIHMDVESCQKTASDMLAAKNIIDQEVSKLGNRVNETVGSAWIASSATEFQSAYQEWAQAMGRISQELDTLKQRFDREITEFEQTAQKLV